MLPPLRSTASTVFFLKQRLEIACAPPTDVIRVSCAVRGQVVFVSSDRNSEAFQDCLNIMPW